MHALNMKYECKGDPTCDFKPHRNIGGFSGHDAHHVCHRIAFHDRKGEGGLLKSQGSCVGWQLWFGNPLNVQTTSGGFLRSSIVDSFNLREADNRSLCYKLLCDGFPPNYFLCSSRGVHLSETLQSSLRCLHQDKQRLVSGLLWWFCVLYYKATVSNFWRLESAY